MRLIKNLQQGILRSTIVIVGWESCRIAVLNPRVVYVPAHSNKRLLAPHTEVEFCTLLIISGADDYGSIPILLASRLTSAIPNDYNSHRNKWQFDSIPFSLYFHHIKWIPAELFSKKVPNRERTLSTVWQWSFSYPNAVNRSTRYASKSNLIDPASETG
jgi:hypothetical protein